MYNLVQLAAHNIWQAVNVNTTQLAHDDTTDGWTILYIHEDTTERLHFQQNKQEHYLIKCGSNSLGISFPLEQVFYSAIPNPPIQNLLHWIFLFPFFSFCAWCCIFVLCLATHTARTFHWHNIFQLVPILQHLLD